MKLVDIEPYKGKVIASHTYCGVNKLIEVDALEEISEQEIVKPYLDKIRAEIETEYGQCDICEYFEDYDYEENDISEYRPIGNIADILQIIDKYKAESEDKE